MKRIYQLEHAIRRPTNHLREAYWSGHEPALLFASPDVHEKIASEPAPLNWPTNFGLCAPVEHKLIVFVSRLLKTACM